MKLAGVKVACIGNMNNNMFALTRHLRDRGLDANLLLFNNEIPHFHPAVDTFDRKYTSYTRRLDWGNFEQFSYGSPGDVLRDLEPYDVLIGCGSAPAYVHKAGRRLDIFAPYGSDLYDLPRYHYTTYVNGFRGVFRNLWWQLENLKFTRMQRKGIVESKNVLNYQGQCDDYFAALKYRGKVRDCNMPMVYTPEFNPKNFFKLNSFSQPYAEMKALRGVHDLIVFHHSRHIWKTLDNPLAVKANDILVRGFADFVHKAKGKNPCLVMFEYGPDVHHTKDLVSALEIEKNVYWFRLLRRKDIMACLSLADIGASEFKTNYISGGAVFEILAMGKPHMGRRDDDLYKNGPELYPMMRVQSPSNVSDALSDYIARPDHFRDMGEQGRQWLQTKVIEHSLDEIEGIIQDAAGETRP